MKIRLPLVLILILSFSLFAAAQNAENDENAAVELPDNVMEQVVRRVLIWKFKLVRRPKTIYLASEIIKPNWLPTIKNIEFRLLSDDEVEDRDEGVYFFTKPEISEGNYQIGFAFGYPKCNYQGEIWFFRISKGKVRLWQNGGMANECESYNAETPGKINSFPNELKGYEFFNRGRLAGIELAVSTREDVQNAFSDACENYCDYDENWEIGFSYFGDISKEITSGDQKTRYVPDARYLGKLYSFHLRPKAAILFDKIVFPSKFKQSAGVAISHDGKGGGARTNHEIYADGYGLKYTIFDELGYSTKEIPRRQKGELLSIEYTIPDELEKEMFVEENKMKPRER